MSTTDTQDQKAVLQKYLNWRLEWHRNHPEMPAQGPSSVTALTYFFAALEAEAEMGFRNLECAILETWRHCGTLHTVIVANSLFTCISRFVEEHPALVEVQIEKSLIPGSVESMSADCNGKLYTRFSTKYVLIIQDDGFPLRSGLDRFIGKADFIGGPREYARDILKVNLLRWLFRECPYNGGFSLRTHRVCKLAAKYWERKWKFRHPSWETIEDVFYTTTLPRDSLYYRLAVSANKVHLGYRFSIEGEYYPERLREMPFGFHSARAFCRIAEKHPEILEFGVSIQ